jgi:Na+/proline symporter
MTRLSAILGMLAGAITVLVWIYAPLSIDGQPLSNWMYEIVPGFIVCSITIIVTSLMSMQKDAYISVTFDKVEDALKEV